MKIIFFSSKPYDKDFFQSANNSFNFDIRFREEQLNANTIEFITDETAICVFVNDTLNEKIISKLADKGVNIIALRCAGFNNIDLNAATKYGIVVVRVPSYSPNSIAEHTIGLILSLNRHIPRAYNRVRDGNFSLTGLMGFDLNKRTAGIIGTGKIGSIVAHILKSFGMHVIAYDPVENTNCAKAGIKYVSKETLFETSDIISLHCPLTSDTQHLINKKSISSMKDGVMLINTSRGNVLDTCAIIEGLKQKKIAYLGLDVYEQESELFFKDMSCEIIQDDIFQLLLTFPNVLVTAHQAFFTEDALTNIATTTLLNLQAFHKGESLINKVK